MVIVKYQYETVLNVGGGFFNGGFCVFGIKIRVLGIHLLVTISLVSEQNLSDWQVILTQVHVNGFPVYKAG